MRDAVVMKTAFKYPVTIDLSLLERYTDSESTTLLSLLKNPKSLSESKILKALVDAVNNWVSFEFSRLAPWQAVETNKTTLSDEMQKTISMFIDELFTGKINTDEKRSVVAEWNETSLEQVQERIMKLQDDNEKDVKERLTIAHELFSFVEKGYEQKYSAGMLTKIYTALWQAHLAEWVRAKYKILLEWWVNAEFIRILTAFGVCGIREESVNEIAHSEKIQNIKNKGNALIIDFRDTNDWNKLGMMSKDQVKYFKGLFEAALVQYIKKLSSHLYGLSTYQHTNIIKALDPYASKEDRDEIFMLFAEDILGSNKEAWINILYFDVKEKYRLEEEKKRVEEEERRRIEEEKQRIEAEKKRIEEERIRKEYLVSQVKLLEYQDIVESSPENIQELVGMRDKLQEISDDVQKINELKTIRTYLKDLLSFELASNSEIKKLLKQEWDITQEHVDAMESIISDMDKKLQECRKETLRNEVKTIIDNGSLDNSIVQEFITMRSDIQSLKNQVERDVEIVKFREALIDLFGWDLTPDMKELGRLQASSNVTTEQGMIMQSVINFFVEIVGGEKEGKEETETKVSKKAIPTRNNSPELKGKKAAINMEIKNRLLSQKELIVSILENECKSIKEEANKEENINNFIEKYLSLTPGEKNVFDLVAWTNIVGENNDGLRLTPTGIVDRLKSYSSAVSINLKNIRAKLWLDEDRGNERKKKLPSTIVEVIEDTTVEFSDLLQNNNQHADDLSEEGSDVDVKTIVERLDRDFSIENVDRLIIKILEDISKIEDPTTSLYSMLNEFVKKDQSLLKIIKKSFEARKLDYKEFFDYSIDQKRIQQNATEVEEVLHTIDQTIEIDEEKNKNDTEIMGSREIVNKFGELWLISKKEAMVFLYEDSFRKKIEWDMQKLWIVRSLTTASRWIYSQFDTSERILWNSLVDCLLKEVKEYDISYNIHVNIAVGLLQTNTEKFKHAYLPILQKSLKKEWLSKEDIVDFFMRLWWEANKKKLRKDNFIKVDLTQFFAQDFQFMGIDQNILNEAFNNWFNEITQKVQSKPLEDMAEKNVSTELGDSDTEKEAELELAEDNMDAPLDLDKQLKKLKKILKGRQEANSNYSLLPEMLHTIYKRHPTYEGDDVKVIIDILELSINEYVTKSNKSFESIAERLPTLSDAKEVAIIIASLPTHSDFKKEIEDQYAQLRKIFSGYASYKLELRIALSEFADEVHKGLLEGDVMSEDRMMKKLNAISPISNIDSMKDSINPTRENFENCKDAKTLINLIYALFTQEGIDANKMNIDEKDLNRCLIEYQHSPQFRKKLYDIVVGIKSGESRPDLKVSGWANYPISNVQDVGPRIVVYKWDIIDICSHSRYHSAYYLPMNKIAKQNAKKKVD